MSAKTKSRAKNSPKKASGDAAAAQKRRAYPTAEERIAMAEAQIERLTKLNAERSELIEKTEKKLAERRVALAKSAATLERAVSRRQRLIDNRDRPEKDRRTRAAKAAEKQQVAELMAALRSSGRSVEDLIASLNK